MIVSIFSYRYKDQYSIIRCCSFHTHSQSMCSIFVESIFSATTSLGNSCSYRSFSLESLVLDVILTILVLSINFLRLLVFFYITCFGFSIDIIISIRGQDLSCPPHARLLLLVNVESLSGLQSRLTCFRIPCIASSGYTMCLP